MVGLFVDFRVDDERATLGPATVTVDLELDVETKATQGARRQRVELVVADPVAAADDAESGLDLGPGPLEEDRSVAVLLDQCANVSYI